jgi:rare lipoprotein A
LAVGRAIPRLRDAFAVGKDQIPAGAALQSAREHIAVVVLPARRVQKRLRCSPLRQQGGKSPALQASLRLAIAFPLKHWRNGENGWRGAKTKCALVRYAGVASGPPLFMRQRHRPCPRLAPFAGLCLMLLAGCASQTPPPAALPQQQQQQPVAPPEPFEPQAFFSQTGVASYYADMLDGRATANGESFDQHAFTAAHPSLAFGTVVRVTNLSNGKMVKVAINDRGPNVKGRIIDLSTAAARALGMEKNGVTEVRLEAFRADQSAD